MVRTATMVRGFAGGVAAFVVGYLAILVVYPDSAVYATSLSEALVVNVMVYAFAHAPYLLLWSGSVGVYFLLAEGVPFVTGAAVYTVPVVILFLSGYFVEIEGSGDTATLGFLRGSTVSIGYLAALLAVLLVNRIFGGGFRGFEAIDILVYFILAPALYAVLFGGLGGLMHQMTSSDIGIWKEISSDEIRNLRLAVLLLALLVVSALAVTPDANIPTEVNGKVTAGVSLDVSEVEEEVSMSVVTMGNADYVMLVGDHGFAGDPYVNETGESLTLDARHLKESGHLTAVGVRGEVEVYEFFGYNVVLEVGEDAKEMPLQTEDWDFTEEG